MSGNKRKFELLVIRLGCNGVENSFVELTHFALYPLFRVCRPLQIEAESSQGQSLPECISRLGFSYAHEINRTGSLPRRSPLPRRKQQQAMVRLTNNAFAHGIENELGRVVQVQFLKNMTAMRLDRVRANVEGRCYFFVCLPFGQ